MSSPASISGLEINLGDFTRTQGLMKSLRLTINNQVAVSVEELASGVGEAGRRFKMGDLDQANQDIARLFASFGQKVSQWENQARNLEHQMKTRAAKNPKAVSINALNQMKTEQIAVRTRIRTAEVQFRRLHQGLDQAFTNLQRQPLDSPSPPALSVDLPINFLASFQDATTADRPVTVKQFFDVEAVLHVAVSRSATSGYNIKFDPLPPLNRLYFFTKTAELVLLKRLDSTVALQNAESGQHTDLKLVDFVKHIQSGVWLLNPR